MGSAQKVITRFPPSPTGFFHVGSARTALFNFLFARKHGGAFLLRYEDTDRARSKREFEEDILKGLAWLGLSHDGEILKQSERSGIYRGHVQTLIKKGHAYVAEDAQSGEGGVIRFRNTKASVTFEDVIRGAVTFDTAELGDFIIARNIDSVLYHLAVVVDDHESGVTHVIRGEDHLSNTPRQMLIAEALGFPRPVYAHLPLILAKDRTKLSKRHGAVSLNDYRELGYMPEAMVNFLALLGWHPEGDRELFSLQELVNAFALERVQKGGAVFDADKLNWLNREHLRALSIDDFAKRVEPYLPREFAKLPQYSAKRLHRLMPVIRERAETLSDVRGIAEEHAFDFAFAEPELDAEKLPWKETAPDTTSRHLAEVRRRIEEIPDADFSAEVISDALMQYAIEAGKGDVLWPMRYALTGLQKSPDPFTVAAIIGKHETLLRIDGAIERIS